MAIFRRRRTRAATRRDIARRTRIHNRLRNRWARLDRYQRLYNKIWYFSSPLNVSRRRRAVPDWRRAVADWRRLRRGYFKRRGRRVQVSDAARLDFANFVSEAPTVRREVHKA